jgi:hypothetical protein
MARKISMPKILSSRVLPRVSVYQVSWYVDEVRAKEGKPLGRKNIFFVAIKNPPGLR